MSITEIIWLDSVVDKLVAKHQVEPEEVEEAFHSGMPESNYPTLPQFDSLNDLVAFFEVEDMGLYWDALATAGFDVDLQQRTRWVAIDAELYDRLAKIAQPTQKTVESLIDSYLRERVS